MIPSQGEKNIRFFCKSHSSFKVRLGILSLYQVRFPNWFEILLLSVEYFQLLALTILVHPNVYHLSNSHTKGPFVFEFVAYIMKLVNPSFLLSFTQNDSTTISVLAIILVFTLVKHLLLLYVISISWLNKTPHSLIKTIWRGIFKLQGRVTCCFLTSFWIRTIAMTSNGSFSIQGISNRVLVSISAILIILEYLISFTLETQFCDFMPTKKYLASKNYEMQILTLLQKLVIHILHLTVYKSLSFSLWTCIMLNLIISLVREYRFFTTLPLYNFHSLQYQGDLSAIVLSLHFAHFFQQILSSSDYQQQIDFGFIIILWIIIGIMSCRLSRTSLEQIFTQLLTSYNPKQNPNLLLHKIFATKHIIKKTKVPGENTEEMDLKYLLGITQALNLPKIFNIQPRDISYDMLMNNKEEETSIILEYLRNLNSQFEGNSLIQLNLAYQKYKSTTFHSKIIKITSKLNENILSSYHMSSALLLLDLEIKNLTQLRDQSLDLLNYIENQISMQDIESEILKQISLRKQMCESIIGDKPDLEAIYQNSQVIHRSKRIIQAKINYFLKRAPEQYLHPLLIFAEYNLYLNYSMEDYQNYYDNYSRKLTRFTKEFELNKISEENLYHNENAFLIISAAANNSIAYSTKSLQDICGIDKNNYTGTHLTDLFPHKLRDYYDKIFKEIFEKGQTKFTNQSIHVYLSHKEGWLVEADMFVRVHPYLSRGLYLDLFIRPHRSSTELILLDEAGKVEGVTHTINQLIEENKLTKTSLHIKQISEELSNLNKAFNITKKKIAKVNLIKKFSKKKTPRIDLTIFQSSPHEMDYEKALRLYNLYTTHSKTIKLPNSKNFQCDISKLDFNNLFLNLIKLEAVSQKTIHQDDSIAPDLEQERKHMSPTPSNRTKHFFQDLPKDNLEFNNETDENLISPTSSRHFFKFSFLPVSSNRQLKTSRRLVTTTPKDLPASTISTTTHENSKIAHSNDVFKIFQRVIKTRSPQKSFNFLCLIFYGVILGTLICQIVLKSVLDTTMNHLLTKTNLLNFAQRRTLQVCTIHNVARGCSLLIGGILTPADMNLADTPLRSNLANMVVPEQVLTRSNEGIIHSIASENNATQHMLFEKDITIRGSIAEPEDSKTESITNFQHSDLLKNAIRLLNGLDLVGSDPGAKAFDFLTKNSANDFLVKNEQIIQTFQTSVNDQKESLQLMISLFVIVIPLFLAGIVCLLAVIIWRQYAKEKRHLLAFLKLNPTSMKHILEDLKSFDNRLIQQEKFQHKSASKSTYRSEYDPQVTSYHKGHDSQRIIYANIQMRYFGYIFKVLFYIALLIVIVIVNYASLWNSIDGIYRQQRQIQFANEISSTTSVTYISFTEMFVTNNTNYIMGQPPFDVFMSGTKNVSKIQDTLYSEFQLKDGDYDPDVKSILFDEIDCNRFVASPYDNCISIKSLGLPSNLASTITLFKNMLDTKLAQFLAVNRSSSSAMVGAALVRLSYILAPYRVTSAEAELLSEIISGKLTHSVADIYDLGTTILTIFSVTLVVVSVLIWFQILTKVKRVNDNFKKVLAVLPPNIILSSFLLKSFLNKTSNIPQKL